MCLYIIWITQKKLSSPQSISNKSKLMSSKKSQTTKNVNSTSIKCLEEKAKTLVTILESRNLFVPNPPTIKDINADKYNLTQRKGNSTGNTKNDKKQIKKQHMQLLKIWIQQMQQIISENDKIIESQSNIITHNNHNKSNKNTAKKHKKSQKIT